MSSYFYYLADENRLIDKRMEELAKMEPMPTFEEMLQECGCWMGPSWLATQMAHSTLQGADVWLENVRKDAQKGTQKGGDVYA